MPSDKFALPNTAELRVEADEARHLASLLRDAPSVADLLTYASALEADASRFEEAISSPRGLLTVGKHGDSSRSNAFLPGRPH